jgi:hypothetical protein
MISTGENRGYIELYGGDKHNVKLYIPGRNQTFHLIAGNRNTLINGSIELKTDVVIDKENRIPVFRAVAQKKDILFDQPERLVNQELEMKSVEGIDGPTIFVGSLEEITTSGNWPRQYALNEK